MNDLREQMLKAGLISKKQARQSAHGERVEHKKADPKKRERNERAAKESDARDTVAQKTRDRQLAAERNSSQERKARKLGDRQRLDSVKGNALRDGVLPNWWGAKTYYFQDGQRVESLQLSEDAARRMERGQAVIVRHQGDKTGYALITSGAAAKLREAAENAIVCWHRD